MSSPFAPFCLSGKKALVTGGTSGIGKAIAMALAEAGAEVIAGGRMSDLTTPKPAGDSDSDTAGRVEHHELDVTDSASIEAIVGPLDRLDLLVNGAGIILREGREFVPENFERVLDVNLTGAMRMSVACRPLLESSRGCIVNVASMLTFFGSGFAPAYSASKGGVGQLTKSLAIAWAASGIRVNAIAPGWIQTALTEPLVRDPLRSRAILDRTPLGRWGTPGDLAGAVMFLASPAAAFITGVVLPIDGGYSIA